MKGQEAPNPVGIWIRVSTEDQVQGESPEHHERRARAYAEAKGWEVVELYRLDAVSGKAVIEHPEAQRMLKDIQSGKIQALIFSKLARLARNTKELLEFADLFRQSGADLVSLGESIDTSSPAGRLFYTMIAAMAQWEREEISARVAASVPVRAKLGKPLGGAAPFGYQWLDKKLVPNSAEAPIRALVHTLFIEHKRKKKVARILNETGHRMRGGSKFSDTTVNRLILDPSAKGIHRRNYTKSNGDGKGWRLKPEEDWIEVPIAPILEAKIWDQANAILVEQQSRSKRPARTVSFLFSGLTFCPKGHKMYVPYFRLSPKYACKSCKTKIEVATLESIYQSQLHKFLLSHDEISRYLETASETLAEKDKLIANIEVECKAVKERMDKLLTLHLDGGLSRASFAREYKPLEERLAQLSDELPALQGEADFLRIKLSSQDDVITQAQDLYARWPSLTHEEKRTIIEYTTSRIVVDPDRGEVDIKLSYLPSSPPSGSSEGRSKKAMKPHPCVAFSQQIGEGLQMPILPFTTLSLSVPIPVPPEFPSDPHTFGEHVKRRRLDLGLTQVEVASRLGVSEATVVIWEKRAGVPPVNRLAKVYGFLGYCLLGVASPSTAGIGYRIRRWREGLGLSLQQLATGARVDPPKLWEWEVGRRKPWPVSIERMERYLSGLAGTAIQLT